MPRPVGSRPVPETSWAELRRRASAVAGHAYAPYSAVRVGAAGLVDDGRVIEACNVENASFGLSLCAEAGLVSRLHATGGGRLVAVAVVADDGLPLSPCGRCRQLLSEAGGPGLVVDGFGTIADLLPHAFGPGDVADRANA